MGFFVNIRAWHMLCKSPNRPFMNYPIDSSLHQSVFWGSDTFSRRSVFTARASSSIDSFLSMWHTFQGLNPDVRYEVQYSSYVNITAEGFVILKRVVKTESFALQVTRYTHAAAKHTS